jgi:AI-2 transport protein TqsA
MSSAEKHVPERDPAGHVAGGGEGITSEHGLSENQPGSEPVQRLNDRLGLATVAGCLIITATGWYLLREFATLLRPLLLAVFLCYTILPTHRTLTRRIPAMASIVILAGISIGLLMLLALLILGSAAQLSDEMPHLVERAQAIIHDAERYYVDHLPPWLADEATEVSRGQNRSADLLKQAASALARAAADILAETMLVGIYLIFLLVEAGRVPQRVQNAFSGKQADQILTVVGNINDAMAR